MAGRDLTLSLCLSVSVCLSVVEVDKSRRYVSADCNSLSTYILCRAKIQRVVSYDMLFKRKVTKQFVRTKTLNQVTRRS